jgi:hypothetical protein
MNSRRSWKLLLAELSLPRQCFHFESIKHQALPFRFFFLYRLNRLIPSTLLLLLLLLFI